jgi:hypothetical protein
VNGNTGWATTAIYTNTRIGGNELNEEICVGRKEIITFFREVKLISPTLEHEKAWIEILRIRKRRKIEELFHRHPNGKPKIKKVEVLTWIKNEEISKCKPFANPLRTV